MPLWVSPDRSALLSPGSKGLGAWRQTWANTGCKACSTPQKVDEKSQERHEQPGNFWTLQAMIGLKPFHHVPTKVPDGPGDFEVTEEADWTTLWKQKRNGPGFIRSGNRVPGGHILGR